MIDGRSVDAIRDPAFDCRDSAAETAKAEAERLIDSEIGIHANARSETETGPTGISPQ
jgi:hypothetical protein